MQRPEVKAEVKGCVSPGVNGYGRNDDGMQVMSQRHGIGWGGNFFAL